MRAPTLLPRRSNGPCHRAGAATTHEVLAPLGITVDHWHRHPDSGVTGGSYAFLTPRELLRIGQLVLQGGRWADEQVIPADWIAAMVTPRFDIDGSPYHGPGQCLGALPRQAYGLHWRVAEVAGRTAWMAAGYGGQYVVVMPSLELVMVLTHDTFHDALGPIQRHVAPLEVLESFIIPALDPASAARSCAPDLFVARADGSGARSIAGHPANELGASWSPDSRRIAFHSFRDLNAELYVVDADGTDLTRLTHDWAADVAPAWSPDGTKLAFLSDRDAGWMAGRPSMDLQVLDLATGRIRPLTDHLGDVRALTWAPDGSRIAFVRSDREDGIGELWQVTADGGTPERIEAGMLGWPSWSPDGRRMAVVTSATETPPMELTVGLLNPETGVIVELGAGPGLPAWTGDGRAIVMSGETETGPQAILIDPDSGERTTLQGVAAGLPSPDGAWVLYETRPSELAPSR